METNRGDDYHITQLARRAQRGDSDALALLADMLRGSLFAVAYAELSHYEDAQDAVASALLRVCRHLPALRSPEKARAWAQQIARNEARRLSRNRLKTPENLLDSHDTDKESDPGRSALLLDIERVLQTLPVEQAQTVTLFYRDGLSVRHIAARLGRPEGTIKYWLHRGRAYLHATLEGYIPMTTSAPVAVLVSSGLSPLLLASMTEALKGAGWRVVRHSAAPSPLVRDNHGQAHLSETFDGCRCVVLDEFVGGRSAFEWLLLFRTTDAGRGIPVLLLIHGSRSEGEIQDTVLAAYLAGFDMCLTKPFDLDEFQQFGKRMLLTPESG